MKDKKLEILVGVFVLIGIFFLVLMTLKIERFQLGKKAGYPLTIYFDSAAGLDQNSPVRVAGVRVGDVERIMLEGGKAKVVFRLPHDIVLYKDAKAYLKSEGFLGERYVEITPGSPENPKLKPGDIIEQGAPPADIEQFLANVSKIREDIKDVVKPLSDVLKSVDSKRVENVIKNFDKFSSQLTGLAKDSSETIKKAKDAFSHFQDIGDKVNKGEGTLGKLIKDDKVYEDVKKTVEVLKEVSEKVNRGEGTLGKLIKDDTVYEEAKKVVESAKEALEGVKVTAKTLKDVSEKIEQGEGTLGKLIKDESLYQEAKDTVKTAKEAIETVKGIAEKVDRGEGTLGKLVSDDQLMKETEKTLKKVQKAAEGIQEQTPITVLGTLIGLFF